MSYSAGTLSEGLDLAVATYLCYCDEARSIVGAYDALGGALLENQDTQGITMAPDAFSNVMMRITALEERPSPNLEIDVRSDLPAPLWPYVGRRQDQIRWSSLGRGIKQCMLNTHNKNTAQLLRIPPHTRIPEHGHGDIEITVVLSGSYCDGQEICVEGDAMLNTPDDVHTPRTQDQPCFCLVVSEKKVHFKSFGHKVAQKIFRF